MCTYQCIQGPSVENTSDLPSFLSCSYRPSCWRSLPLSLVVASARWLSLQEEGFQKRLLWDQQKSEACVCESRTSLPFDTWIEEHTRSTWEIQWRIIDFLIISERKGAIDSLSHIYFRRLSEVAQDDQFATNLYCYSSLPWSVVGIRGHQSWFLRHLLHLHVPALTCTCASVLRVGHVVVIATRNDNEHAPFDE